MKFAIYLPPSIELNSATTAPVMYVLSGRGSNETNFINKSGFQRFAAKVGLVVVCSDTSPRDTGIEGENEGHLVGSGVSYYVNATSDKWKSHYQMYTYISEELPAVIEENFKQVDTTRASICGHSMGGHGALMAAFKRPGSYKCVSAFAPVTSVIASPRQQTTMIAYLGENRDNWKEWDAVELMKTYDGPELDILIDQGSVDEYLKVSILPELLMAHIPPKSVNVNYRMHANYDHGYSFIQTFIEDHIRFHAKNLGLV